MKKPPEPGFFFALIRRPRYNCLWREGRAAGPAIGELLLRKHMHRVMETPAKLFIVAMGSAALGGFLFLIGLGMAFGPGQAGGGDLVILAVPLVGFGAAANVITSVWGLVIALAEYRIRWWWPLSLIALAGTAWGVSMLLSL